MDDQQGNVLSTRLEEKLTNILAGFNKVLEEHGFPETYVIEFTAQSLGANSPIIHTVCKDKPPRCSPVDPPPSIAT